MARHANCEMRKGSEFKLSSHISEQNHSWHSRHLCADSSRCFGRNFSCDAVFRFYDLLFAINPAFIATKKKYIYSLNCSKCENGGGHEFRSRFDLLSSCEHNGWKYKAGRHCKGGGSQIEFLRTIEFHPFNTHLRRKKVMKALFWIIEPVQTLCTVH